MLRRFLLALLPVVTLAVSPAASAREAPRPRPGIEEPVSGSLPVAGRNLAYFVYQKRVFLEVREGSSYTARYTLAADRALLSYLAAGKGKAQLASLFTRLVERSRAPGRQEMLTALSPAPGEAPNLQLRGEPEPLATR